MKLPNLIHLLPNFYGLQKRREGNPPVSNADDLAGAINFQKEEEEEEYRLHWVRQFGGRRDLVKSEDMPRSLAGRREAMRFPLRPEWALTDPELAAVLKNFSVDSSRGITGLTEQALKQTWSIYMSTDLCNWWLFWLLGAENEVHPSKSFKRLCHLLKSHSEGSLPVKAVNISQIILNRGLKKFLEKPVISHEVNRYFQKVTSTYIKYLYYRGDGNAKMWRAACVNPENKLTDFISEIMGFYRSTATFKDIFSKVLFILEIAPIFDDISSATVAFCFGYGKVENFIPRLIAGSDSMVGVLQATFFSYLLKGNRNDNFKWEMLYNSKIHGTSYKSFYQYVVGEYSTIIFIKEHNGNLFGAYIDDSWRKGNYFFGGKGCFLFRIYPHILLCQTSGSNRNYCYFNYSSDNEPKGVAFGGQMGFFGLHFDLDTRRGKVANTCSTFEEFECLSSQNYFEIDQIEVWSILPDFEQNRALKTKEDFPPIKFPRLMKWESEDFPK